MDFEITNKKDHGSRKYFLLILYFSFNSLSIMYL